MLLRSLTFPAAIHSLALQPGEQCLYAGASDGRIFEASLIGESPRPAASSATAAANGQMLDEHYNTLRGHGLAVNALAFSSDARLLISGPHIWSAAALWTGVNSCRWQKRS